jgi:succinate dehydrogenase/fumarate reductase flavoprotein subunit
MEGNWSMALDAQEYTAKQAGAQFVFNTEAKELIVDANGNVTGVYVEVLDGENKGKLFKVTANKGVILAAGDYSGNATMVKVLCPEYEALGAPIPNPDGDTGSGHKMAIWAGGVMEPSPHAAMAHTMMFMSQIGIASSLYLNANGERFMNEDVSGQLITNQISRQPGKTYIQVFDSDVATRLPNVANDSHTAADLGNKTTADYIQSTLDPTGGSNTIDGLVAAIFPEDAVARANAKAEILRYNQLYTDGFDADFGVAHDQMWPLLTPPFYYAANPIIAAAVTTSGVIVDKELRVLNGTTYKPIPGLFAVGKSAGKYAATHARGQ